MRKCAGQQIPTNILTDYILQLFRLSKNLNVPLFLSSWLSNLSHDDENGIRKLDPGVAKFFETLNSEGHLENTLVFFISDHGYRYGTRRASISGWYEDKMPNLWIHLPQKYADSNWIRNLKENSR